MKLFNFSESKIYPLFRMRCVRCDRPQNQELDLVSIAGQKAVTTSLVVAEAFKKQHKHVLRDIEALECSEEFSRSNFGPSTFVNRGKQYPCFNLTRDGFTFLAMGMTGLPGILKALNFLK